MLVNIDNEEAIEMLMRRLSYWTDDETTHKLYRQMYENYVEGGCFDGGEFDIMAIVDNDYVNNCDMVSEGDDLICVQDQEHTQTESLEKY